VREFRHGLLIGKFYPPHLGHHAAIRRATAECEQVSVLVIASAAESTLLADRVGWLRAEHDDVDVIGVRCDAPLDVTDERVWTAHLATMSAALRSRGTVPVDAVYCGDAYGAGLAQRFDAKWVPLERDGRSSTAIRADLAGHWDDLAPATQAGMATRVVVVGAESTGTTTASRELAEHYRRWGGVWARTQWVAEYGRDYTDVKWAAEGQGRPLEELVWTVADFDAVATEQTRREEAAARIGSPLLVCDTDAFATAVWERRYLGAAGRTGQAWADGPRRDVYLVTDHHDVPWLDDGMREGDLEIRAAMTDWFVDALTADGHSWVLLTGPLDERMDLAVRTVDQLLAVRARFAEPLHGPGFGE
jgi:HTH-type transcriptional repressor of NAD biosynthesis genes